MSFFGKAAKFRSKIEYRSKIESFGRSENNKNMLYCEVCEVPCSTLEDLQDHFKEETHKKKERALMYGGFKVEELERIIQKVRCLQDYVDEPIREPLVGLEYVVEFKNPRMAEPDYECKMCKSRSKLIPLIVHLNGLKHRKAYLSKHFPFTAKTRHPDEDIFQFLRRLALEIERYRGLKTFLVESSKAKKKRSSSSSGKQSDSLKRSRWDADIPDDEPQRTRTMELQDTTEKVAKAKRVADFLNKIRPLNKEEAIAMQRAKAMNRAAAFNPSAEKGYDGPLAAQEAFQTGQQSSDNARSQQEHELQRRSLKNMGLKDSSLWGTDEWNRLFLGRANRNVRRQTFEKDPPPWNTSSERSSNQLNTQKKESVASAEKNLEAERRAEADWRKEAEKRSLAERIAKAKTVEDPFTLHKTGPKNQTTQKQSVRESARSNATIIKADEQTVRATGVAEAITQNSPNLPNPGGRQGRWKSLAHEENDLLRQNSLPWMQAQTVPAPATPLCLSEESVVNVLENFLQQSLGPVEPERFSEGINRQPAPLMQNQQPQFVTAGRTWNLVPIAQKQQLQHAVGRGQWNEESLMQKSTNTQIYDPPNSSFSSSLLNPLKFETRESHSSIFGEHARNSVRPMPLSDSRDLGGYIGNHGLIKEYNRADNGLYPSSRTGGGPLPYSSDPHGADYQFGSLNRNNPSGTGAKRMSNVASNNWHQGSLSLTPKQSLSQGYNSNLPVYADRASRSLLGSSYIDGRGEMTQKPASKRW